MVICYLGVGSNLGNRQKNIKLALKKINDLEETRIIKSSRIFETEPVGSLRAQPKFLNSALKVETGLSATSLLENLKKIEKELGRVKTFRCGPRVIDLDILLYGDKIINKPGLNIPHPKMFEREFVLQPLREII
jgi:2-amino-4-hydroxy-6-hydroxymethyldihydropteridine diphosphokinase